MLKEIYDLNIFYKVSLQDLIHICGRRQREEKRGKEGEERVERGKER
jgi:hypothetical protein